MIWHKTALLVLITGFITSWLHSKFRHSTAIGDKQVFHNCRIQLENGTWSTESIEIATAYDGIKFVEA